MDSLGLPFSSRNISTPKTPRPPSPVTARLARACTCCSTSGETFLAGAYTSLQKLFSLDGLDTPLSTILPIPCKNLDFLVDLHHHNGQLCNKMYPLLGIQVSIFHLLKGKGDLGGIPDWTITAPIIPLCS